MADVDREIVELRASIANLIQALTRSQQEHQETRSIMEKLGRVAGLEYSQDVSDWVSKKKLTELKAHPRDDDPPEN